VFEFKLELWHAGQGISTANQVIALDLFDTSEVDLSPAQW
jgi:hypothetical protein